MGMTILKNHHTFRLSWINLRAESPGRFNIMPTCTHFKTARNEEKRSPLQAPLIVLSVREPPAVRYHSLF